MIDAVEIDTEDEARQRGYDHVRIFVHGRMIGFRALGGTKVCLTRCPRCWKENYIMNVTSGWCTWCPFSVEQLHIIKKGQGEAITKLIRMQTALGPNNCYPDPSELDQGGINAQGENIE